MQVDAAGRQLGRWSGWGRNGEKTGWFLGGRRGIAGDPGFDAAGR